MTPEKNDIDILFLDLGLPAPKRETLENILKEQGQAYRSQTVPGNGAARLAEFQKLLHPSPALKKGCVILVGLSEEESRQLVDLTHSGLAHLLREAVRLTNPSFVVTDTLGILALVEKHGANSPYGRVVVLANVPSREIIVRDKIKDFLTTVGFRVADSNNLDAGLLDLALRRECFGFGGDRDPINRDPPDPSANWGPLALDRHAEFHERLKQEFNSEDLEKKFLDLCRGEFDSQEPSLPGSKEYLVALNVLRLCRRMVTWTLEGDPFWCTVLLCSTKRFHDKSVGPGAVVQELFPVKIPFRFDLGSENESRAHALAEMIQSDGLLLFVNVADGCARNISLMAGEHLYRLERLGSLTNRGGIVFHMHGGHIVEIFASNDLMFRHDGFRWWHQPLHDLNLLLSEWLGIVKSNLKPKDRTADEKSLRETIFALLDAHNSSIIVLLGSKKDNDRLQELIEHNHLEEMRKDIPSSIRPGKSKSAETERPPIWQFPVASLKGILLLDGAQVIDEKGRLMSLALDVRLKVKQLAEFTQEDATRLEDWRKKHEEKRKETKGDEEGDAGFVAFDAKCKRCIIPESLHGVIKTAKDSEQDDDTQVFLERVYNSMKPTSSVPGGTGTSAAHNLSLVLTDSYIIKVSASGSLKLFHNGEMFSPAAPGPPPS